jgi:PhnB protein
MQLNPYLSFNGQCEAAFKFYEQVLGGTITSMFTYTGTPMEANVPPDKRNQIMHASMQIGNCVLMGADTPEGRHATPSGFSVMLEPNSIEEAERIFNNLAEGGNVLMPLQSTFWAARFGMLADRFGTPWMINYGEPS